MTRPRTSRASIAARIVLASAVFLAGLFVSAQNQPNGRQHLEQKQQSRANQAVRNQRRPGEWLSKHKDQPVAEQEKELESDPDFQRRPADQQQKMRERLQWFNNLPPQRKEKVLNRMKAFEQLTPEQRQQARELQGKLKDVPPDHRQQMRIALRNLRGMDPQQREQVINSNEFRSHFSHSEREVLRGLSQIPQPATHPPASNEPAPH